MLTMTLSVRRKKDIESVGPLQLAQVPKIKEERGKEGVDAGKHVIPLPHG